MLDLVVSQVFYTGADINLLLINSCTCFHFVFTINLCYIFFKTFFIRIKKLLKFGHDHMCLCVCVCV